MSGRGGEDSEEPAGQRAQSGGCRPRTGPRSARAVAELASPPSHPVRLVARANVAAVVVDSRTVREQTQEVVEAKQHDAKTAPSGNRCVVPAAEQSTAVKQRYWSYRTDAVPSDPNLGQLDVPGTEITLPSSRRQICLRRTFFRSPHRPHHAGAVVRRQRSRESPGHGWGQDSIGAAASIWS